MPDKFPSAAWTGPLDEIEPRQRYDIFTHGRGEAGITTDYERLAEIARVRALIPTELRPVLKLAAWLLVSPVSLWVGNVILTLASNDWRVADRSDELFLWGVGMVILAGWQLTARSLSLLDLRCMVLALAIVATIGLAVSNVYLGLRSNSEALASAPERTYVRLGTSGRGPFRTTTATFQRADGSFVDGRPATTPLEYGPTCALVQRLDGPDGYSWVRVREWSRSPGSGELAWPIRREECFSTIPLSTLPR